MKKLFTAISLLLITSQFINVPGQKHTRVPRKAIQPAVLKTAKTPVSQTVKTAQAFSDGNGVLLKWQTGNENDLIGFNIYRADGLGNVRINKNLILSSTLRNGPASKSGSEYTYFDESGSLQNSFLIETLSSDGNKAFYKPILPNYVSDFKKISELSSESLRRSATSEGDVIEESKPVLYPGFKRNTENKQALTDLETQKWVAAQPGVKITITKEGLYRVTRAELQAAGFDVNASSNLWQLYTNGIEQAIIVDPNDQYIEFYGARIPEKLESNKQTYFLLVGPNAGKRMNTRTVRPVGGTLPATTFYSLQTTKERSTYVSTILNGDNQNFFGTFISDTPATLNFVVRGIDYSIRKTSVFLKIQGLGLTPHTTKFVINGVELGTISGSNRESSELEFSLPTQYLIDGNNTLELTALEGPSDFSLFDSITVNLQRKYSAFQNQLSFNTNDRQSCDITGFSSPSIRVFDVTSEGNTTSLTNLNIYELSGVYNVNIPAFETRNLFAVTDEAVKQVDSIKQNLPSTLSTAAHNGQLIIITHKNWLTEANTWANYRRSDGLTVEVVDVEDIYDEFNFGKLSAQSILDFAQYAKNNWQTPPGYFLIIGDATYDPLNHTGVGDNNFVPTKMVDTIYTETGSDDALTDFNTDGLAEIPIGRIPVRTSAEVTHLFNKVTVFEQNVNQNFSRGAFCVSDLPEGYDFAALCTRVFNELPTDVPKSYLNRGEPNSPSLLLSSLNSGKFLVNYSGHGHTSIWASNTFFNNAAALTLNNGNNLSVFTMLTCLNGYFVETATQSLGESLLRTPNGGAVVAWASSGLTTPDVQEIMARRFYHQIGVGNMTRMGDLVNDAKSVINGGRDVRLSWVLLGDPTLKVRP